MEGSALIGWGWHGPALTQLYSQELPKQALGGMPDFKMKDTWVLVKRIYLHVSFLTTVIIYLF